MQIIKENTYNFLNSIRNWFTQRDNYTIFAILTIALCLRIWGLGFGLPHRYHLDEPPSILAALDLGRGNFQPAYPLLSPNIQEVLYLFLFSLLFLWYFLTGKVTSPGDFANQYQNDPTNMYLLARGLSVAASLVTIYLLYRLTKQYKNQKTALIASIFLTVCFLDVRHAHFAEVYSILSLLAIGTIYSTLIYLQNGRLRVLIAAGILCGIAIGLRFSMLPLAITILFGLYFPIRGKNFGWSTVKIFIALMTSILVGILIGAPTILVNTYNFVANFSTLIGLAGSQQGLWGYKFSDLPTWQFYTIILEIAFGLPLVLLTIFGIGKSIYTHTREDILMLSFPSLYLALLLTASTESSAYARYLVPALPFFAFYAADATVTLVGRLTRRLSPRMATWALSGAMVLILVIPSYRILLLDRLWSTPDTRTLAKEWIENNISGGTKIANQWNGPPLSSDSNPESNSTRIYQYDYINPFSDDENLYQLEYYQQSGYEYIILSSFIYKISRIREDDNRFRLSFYDMLDQQSDLIAEFHPYKGNIEPRFFFEEIWGPITNLTKYDRPGPTIKIYKINQ